MKQLIAGLTMKQWVEKSFKPVMILFFFSLVFFSFALSEWVYPFTWLNPPIKHIPSPQDFQRTVVKEVKPVIGKSSWYDYHLENYPNYSKDHYTAASRDYPRGTMLKVCRTIPGITINQTEITCIDVRVNDFVENKDVIIDLSSAAFKELAPLGRGVIEVEIIEL